MNAQVVDLGVEPLSGVRTTVAGDTRSLRSVTVSRGVRRRARRRGRPPLFVPVAAIVRR